MKKTRNKHLLRTIKKNGVSFFAVAFIAATSIAIFMGMQSSAIAILKEAGRYFINNHLETMEISCANGITREDIDAISQWEDVDTVEGGYTDMAFLDAEREKITVQTRSLCGKMNDPVIIEGTLPEAPDEAAIEEIFADEQGIQVGDEITLEHDGNLVSDSFHVTAIINEPAFCCSNIEDSRGKSTSGLGSAAYYMELPIEAFDADYYEDCFTTAHVRNDALSEIYYYSKDYESKEAVLKERLEELGKERAELRYTSLDTDAKTAIEDAEKELADSEEKLNDGTEELEQKREELDSARDGIELQLSAMGVTTDLNAALEQLEPFGNAALPMKTAITDFQDAEAQLEDAEKELEDSREELEDAKQELKEAKEDAEDIQLKDWIVSVRNDIGDIRGVETIVEGIYGLSYSLSIIFLLVAIVVCHTAISRMINEQRGLIGAQKALGFHSGEILKHYMLYNTLCALLGILLGWLFGIVIVEILVLHIFKAKFVLGSIGLTFAWKEALIAAGVCLVIFLTATYMTCAKLVRQPSTTLLRGEVPVQGKKMFFEKWNCYKKLNLYSRTMIKNVMNDKGRMMTTIMGVVGCISLLVICFSLKMAIENSSIKQFDDYYLYENRLVIDTDKQDAKDFEEILDEDDISYMLVQDKLKNFRVDQGRWENARIITATDFEKLKDFIVLEDIKTKETAPVPEDGLLVSRKCAQDFELSEGSKVELMDSEGNAREFQIAGVIEHYLPYHLFVTTDSYFESVMGEEADGSVFLLNGDITGLYDQVRDMDGYLSLKDNSEFDADADAINLVIVICLVLSAVMALLVLLNQIVMHINRKSRELAVMRINGYTMKETKAYVYKDNIILTILGLIIGSGFGTLLSYVVIRVIETGASRYVRTPNLLACLYACAVGALFAIIVNFIALRKIEHLNLTNVSGN